MPIKNALRKTEANKLLTSTPDCLTQLGVFLAAISSRNYTCSRKGEKMGFKTADNFVFIFKKKVGYKSIGIVFSLQNIWCS